MKAGKRDGNWFIELGTPDEKPLSPAYSERLLRYLDALDPAFERAYDRCEFEFIMCLLRVRGASGPGWDPFSTTSEGLTLMTRLHETIEDMHTARHLELWIYGHLVEASEPYEILSNLIDIANGGRWMVNRFPRVGGNQRRPGRPQNPGRKIRQISEQAISAGMPGVSAPLLEMWDAELRNAAFHADYALYGTEVRIFEPFARSYSGDDVLRLVNSAHAFHAAMSLQLKFSVGQYPEPKVIRPHPDFSGDPDERAVVIVREGYGVVGMKDGWTDTELSAGRIPFQIGTFFPAELAAMDADHNMAFLPKTLSESPAETK